MKLGQKVFISKSEEQTRAFAAEFAESLEKGGVIALYGDLGAGKTTFVQGFAEGLGIKKRITSPTFVIMHAYQLPFTTFYHIDLYRLENSKHIEELGLKELIESSENIIVIEWAEKMRAFLPDKRFDIHFEYENQTNRKIIVEQLR